MTLLCLALARQLSKAGITMLNKNVFSALLLIKVIKQSIKKIALFLIRTFFHCLDMIRYYSVHQFNSKIIATIVNEKHTSNSSDSGYDTLAVFAIFQPKGLSTLLKRSINYLSRHKVKVMIVAPHPLNSSDIAFLEQRHCMALQRANFGRDFGSYKYGILYLLNNLHLLKPYKKILLVNDSIVFPLKEQDDSLRKILTYSHDVIGLAEGYVDHWHIGSYFILFKKEFFLENALQEFWRRYKPYPSRVYCINKGEIILSQTILKLAHPNKTIKLIYENRKILNALEKSLVLNKTTPLRLTQLIHNNLLTKLTFSSDQPINLKEIAHTMERLSLIHYFALILIEYLDCFFIKRDLCFREIFTVSQILHYIATINENEDFIEQLSLDLKHKGKTSSLPFFNKLLTYAAII